MFTIRQAIGTRFNMNPGAVSSARIAVAAWTSTAVKARRSEFDGRLVINAKAAKAGGMSRAVIAKNRAGAVEKLRQEKETLVSYSDGSKTARAAGAGIVAYHGSVTVFKEAIGMDPEVSTKAESVDVGFSRLTRTGPKVKLCNAESLALRRALTRSLDYVDAHPNAGIKKVYVYSDDRVAVQTLLDERVARGVVDDFLKKDGGRAVRIEWVPAHKGIQGNVEADKKAKEGSRK